MPCRDSGITFVAEADMLTVRVPATIANMGPGFDSFGMAVGLHNTFVFSPAEHDELVFSPDSAADTSGLSTRPEDSILFEAMRALPGWERPPLRVEITTDIPVARGLGSSSTAIVAGLVAANRLAGNPLGQDALLDLAITIEGHPDNVAPALLGGVVLYDTRAYRLPWPSEWRILALSPDYPVLTEEARRILPRHVALDDAIWNLRKSAVLTYALLQADAVAFGKALDDKLHQPYRRKLIKEYDAIEKATLEAGAHGMIISGSGPTMAVFYPAAAEEDLLGDLNQLIAAQGWKIERQVLQADTAGAVCSTD